MSAEKFRQKMSAAGIREPAIRSFERCYEMLVRKETGMIPESSIEPVEELPTLARIEGETSLRTELLRECAVLKLNGGLGTSMGLEKAKSLLEVRRGLTFLDLIARQILHFRRTCGSDVRFLLLNSFNTSADTREFLAKYPELGDPDEIELMQNRVPKVDAATLEPVSWPKNPELEWCPPGHGDLYTALADQGVLHRLLEEGVKFLFVSNSDNLGATLHTGLLTWFADSGAPFMMEVTARTASDRKGGHLAQREGRLLLRESAQCPDEDVAAFQDISRHRFFNTNNLWLRLDRLEEALTRTGGFLPLPMICNKKTVDPRDKTSPAVYQLETAMGAAIEYFPDAVAVEVPRDRFAPVKTTADLIALRSDAYEVAEDGAVKLVAERAGRPPRVTLDERHFKLVDQLEQALPDGAPSLRHCDGLTVEGAVVFSPDAVFEGDVRVLNPHAEPRRVPPGRYKNQTLTL